MLKYDEVEISDSEGEVFCDFFFIWETGKHYVNFVRMVFFGFYSMIFKCSNFESIWKIILSEEGECWVLMNWLYVFRFLNSGKEMFWKYVESVF